METKKRRIRRTNAEVESAIANAMDKLVKEHGLLKVTANMVIAEAKIESPVFYNRYDTIDDLIYERLSETDFWIKDTLSFREIEKIGPEEYYVQTLLKLLETLRNSKTAREVLIWELMSESEAAYKIARLKEMENEALLVYYSKLYEKKSINIRAMTSLLISSIYYLLIHKDKSTFCGLDINKKDGREAIENLIRNIVKGLFSDLEQSFIDSRTINAAKRMAEKGIDIKTISDVLEIEEDDLVYVLNKK